jgi:hypothetical protein
MLLFVGVWFEGSRRRRVMGVVAWYSENFGNYLHFKAYGAAGLTFQLDYSFDIDLFAPNYPVIPMPVAAIESRFRLILELGYFNLGHVLERRYLVNESFGYISASNSYYRVGLGNQNGYCFDYEVKIPPKKKKAELFSYRCCSGRSILAPISLLL